jgi:hypothetical protein
MKYFSEYDFIFIWLSISRKSILSCFGRIEAGNRFGGNWLKYSIPQKIKVVNFLLTMKSFSVYDFNFIWPSITLESSLSCFGACNGRN